MNRAAAVLAAGLVFLSSACASRPGPGGPPPRAGKPNANPSALIAAEIAFNRLAQDKGQWAAFRETAAEDAVMFTPQPVNAQAWLKGRAEPAETLTWQPHQVWMSCDGTMGATKGAWQKSDDTFGYFTTVWKRYKGGEYKWVLDQGDALKMPLEAPEMLSADVADCDRKASAGVAVPADAPALGGKGASRDRSFEYSYAVDPSGERNLLIAMWQDGELRQMLTSRVLP